MKEEPESGAQDLKTRGLGWGAEGRRGGWGWDAWDDLVGGGVMISHKSPEKCGVHPCYRDYVVVVYFWGWDTWSNTAFYRG